MVDVLQNFKAISDKPGKYAMIVERHLPRTLAVLMLVFVVVDLEYNLTRFDFSTLPPFEYVKYLILPVVSDVLVLVSSIAIFRRRSISNSRAISIYLLSLSVSRLLIYFLDLWNVDIIAFLIAIVMCTLSANMVITGVSFYKGISRNRNRIMTTSMATIIAYIMLLSFKLHYSPDSFSTLIDNASLVIQIILYVVLLAALDSYDVSINTNIGRLYNASRELVASVGATDKTILSEAEARTIVNGFGNMDGWTPVSDGSPVEYEYEFTISIGCSNSQVLLQRWRGSDKVHFTIADSFAGSVVFAKRFSASRYAIDSGRDSSYSSILLMDDRGDCIRFQIMDDVGVGKLHQEARDES